MSTIGFSQPASRDLDKGMRLRGRVIFGFLAMTALVGGVSWWAMSTTISGAVISQGAVKVVEELKTVQHRDGGIIAAIAATPGDQVSAGDVLIRLDDAQTRAELAIISGQQDEFGGRRARLVAERDGLEQIVFPYALAVGDAKLAELIEGETQLFKGNLQMRSRQKEQLALQEVQLGQEINGLRAQLEAVDTELLLVEGERANLEKLAKDGLVEGTRLYSMNREVARMQGQRAEIEASIARSAARINEVVLQRLGIDETARTEAIRELRAIDASLAELAERRAAVEDRLSRTEIRAPIDGIVNAVNTTTVGGVITPAEVLVTVVPIGAELKVEARLRTVDVDQISVGQPAKLRFSAFNQRTTPEVAGTVTRVAAAAQTDSVTGEAYYVADVSFGAEDLEGFELRPGMPVEVFVETAQLSPLAYLAKPFTDQIARAFREE